MPTAANIFNQRANDAGYAGRTYDKITQADIDYINNTYGRGSLGSLKAGDSLANQNLIQFYMGRTPESGDPIQAKLLSTDLLQQGSDAQGNTSYLYGPAYQALVDSSFKGDPSKGLPKDQVWEGPYSPYGLQAQHSHPYGYAGQQDAHTYGGGTGAVDLGEVDPVTGVHKWDFSKFVPAKPQASWWDKFDPGPVIGMAVGAGMGGLGMFDPMGGSLGKSFFDIIGKSMIGGDSPFSNIASLFGGGGGAPGAPGGGAAGGGAQSQLTPQQMQQLMPILMILSLFRGGGGNG